MTSRWINLTRDRGDARAREADRPPALSVLPRGRGSRAGPPGLPRIEGVWRIDRVLDESHATFAGVSFQLLAGLRPRGDGTWTCGALKLTAQTFAREGEGPGSYAPVEADDESQRSLNLGTFRGAMFRSSFAELTAAYAIIEASPSHVVVFTLSSDFADGESMISTLHTLLLTSLETLKPADRIAPATPGNHPELQLARRAIGSSVGADWTILAGPLPARGTSDGESIELTALWGRDLEATIAEVVGGNDELVGELRAPGALLPWRGVFRVATPPRALGAAGGTPGRRYAVKALGLVDGAVRELVVSISTDAPESVAVGRLMVMVDSFERTTKDRPGPR